MKFLVTGSAGLVGSQVIKDLVRQNHIVYSGYHNAKPINGIPIQINLTKQEKIIQTLEKIKPDVIIHLAAITDVELSESIEQLSTQINVKATETIAKQAAKQQAFFVYLSTDYVFDGKNGMYKENNHTHPLGVYGKTKLEGENVLNRLSSEWCIVRTSTPFGIHNKKKSFPIWVKENLELKKKIRVVDDQFTSPTYVPNLSKMLIEISIRKIIGVIHLAGSTRISRYDLAILVADNLNLDKKLIIPTKTHSMKWKAQRPKDSSLDISYGSEILNEKPMRIENSLKLFFSELQNN
jgi:dTDP-4-dehydrorhamnose reductase